MAMSLRGSKRYYKLGNPFAFTLEHLLSTAELCEFSRDEMLQIIENTLAQTERVLEQAEALLPNDFKESVSMAKGFCAEFTKNNRCHGRLMAFPKILLKSYFNRTLSGLRSI